MKMNILLLIAIVTLWHSSEAGRWLDHKAEYGLSYGSLAEENIR
jgi:hypothetical protein